jgi:hypothetical protein
MELVIGWAKALVVTVAVEIPIAAIAFRRDEPSLARRAGLIFFASLATHPAVWFIFPRFELTYGEMIIAAETWAVVVEAVFFVLVFRGVEPWRAAGVSLIANGASYGTGLLLRAFTHWV